MAQNAGEDDNDRRYTVIYFGYGSNLSPRSMKQRCPDSLFIGLGKIAGWRWQINETGYANIVPGEKDDVVYGTLSFLSAREEAALDESEGVPWMYQKLKLKATRVIAPEDKDQWGPDAEAQEIEVMTYVDEVRTADGVIEKEYVTLVRKAVRDAEQLGVPKEYAEKYIKPFVPTVYDWSDQDIVMVRTLQFGDKSASMVPRGFASWSRG